MEPLFLRLSDQFALFIEVIAVLVATGGAFAAFVALGRVVAARSPHGARKQVWRDFGMWLLLALEFELAADIIRSVIAPTWKDIGALGAIAVIRTFLNYFLERDLEASAEHRS